MSDRFPLILNTSTNQIQEIASGDTLDLTGNNIKGVGIITATTISGTLSGIATLARGLTDIPSINVTNITGVGATFSGAIDANGDLDVDGHTNLDNINISGVTTTTGVVVINGGTQSTNSTSGALRVAGGAGIAKNVNVGGDLDVDGHTNLDNVSVGGATTITATNREIPFKVVAARGGGGIGTYLFTNSVGRFDFNFENTYNGNWNTGSTFHTRLLWTAPNENATTPEVCSIFPYTAGAGAGGALHSLEFSVTDNTSGLKKAYWMSHNKHQFYLNGNQSALEINSTLGVGVTSYIYHGGASDTHTRFGFSGNDNIIFDTNGTERLRINNSSSTFSNNIIANGNIDLNADLDVDGHTNLDNVSVAGVTTFAGAINGSSAAFTGNVSVGGVLTYEDVTNVDSVGIVTARNGIKVLAGGANVVGVVTATTLNAGSLRLTDDGASGPIASIMADDGNPWALQIGNSTYSTSLSTGHQFFVASGNGNAFHEVRSSTSSYTDYILRLNNSGNTTKNGIKIDGSDQSVILYAGGSEMLQTTSTGATLLGELNATGANFTDDGQSSPTVSIMTDDGSPWALQVGNSTYGNNTNGWQVYVNNTGEGYQYHIGSGAYKDFHFYQHNQSQSRLMIKFEADDNSVELYNAGTKRLETTGTGVVVAGVCTATSFSGDGSNLTGVSVGISTEQVTPSSNVATLNLAKDDHKIVASGTYTIDVSGGTEAGTHTLRIENSGTANVGFSTYFKFPSGGTPSLPTASGAISLISFSVHKVGSVGIATVLLAGASVNFS